VDPIDAENTLWMNTVLASQGYVIAVVVYTGRETRAVMNTSTPSTKVGLLDWEINRLSMVSFFLEIRTAFIFFKKKGENNSIIPQRSSRW
jgi:phospholipid-translocating ATPase